MEVTIHLKKSQAMRDDLGDRALKRVERSVENRVLFHKHESKIKIGNWVPFLGSSE
jgi:hypothetical protein